MKLTNQIIENDTIEIINSPYIDWAKFSNKTVLITGATGLIGTKLIKTLLLAPQNIKVIALARSKDRLESHFKAEIEQNLIIPIYQDIINEITYDMPIDYIIHTACGTTSKGFIENPVETIDTIINGTKNILSFAHKKQVKSVVHLSSMEVYGETDFNRQEPLRENNLGNIDLLNPRSSYPEGKRLAETLCAAFAKEYNVPVKIARLVQIIASNAALEDKRIITYMARCAVDKTPIILQSTGESSRNFCYITDCITGILTILLKGENGRSYNVANQQAFASIKDLAQHITTKYNLPPINFDIDKTGKYPTPSKLFVDCTQLNNLNWQATVSLEEMFERVINSFKKQLLD